MYLFQNVKQGSLVQFRTCVGEYAAESVPFLITVRVLVRVRVGYNILITT